jgi:hypothetical protein
MLLRRHGRAAVVFFAAELLMEGRRMHSVRCPRRGTKAVGEVVREAAPEKSSEAEEVLGSLGRGRGRPGRFLALI